MGARIWKAILPVAAMGLGLLAAGCDKVVVDMGDADGVPLAELDTTGDAPTRLVLAGPDSVVVSQGDTLDIDVTGDPQAAEALRFKLADGTLSIMRTNDWSGKETATVAVTMPAARELVMAGSGTITAPALADRAEVDIAGSGTIAVDRIAASRLDVNVMGSGRLRAAGTADRLEFNVAGSGDLDARALKVERAEINIAGSGSGTFASDGKVAARILGSGSVTVLGRADCKVDAMGSGTLRCQDAGTAPAAQPAETR